MTMMYSCMDCVRMMLFFICVADNMAAYVRPKVESCMIYVNHTDQPNSLCIVNFIGTFFISVVCNLLCHSGNHFH